MLKIVHMSGVVDKELNAQDMLDSHCILVDSNDHLGNIPSLKILKGGRYTGYVAYEYFAEVVHKIKNIEAGLCESAHFIEGALA